MAAFRLTKLIGGMTVGEFKARCSAVEFDQWMDFFEGDATWDRLVHTDKMAPEIATQMVWMSPAQREAQTEARLEDAAPETDQEAGEDDGCVDDD